MAKNFSDDKQHRRKGSNININERKFRDSLETMCIGVLT